MRINSRRTLIGLGVAGLAGVILFMPAIYFWGLWLAPPRPVPAVTHVPPLVGDAIWARADGGRATELRPINPITFLEMRACRFRAAATDDVVLRGQRRAECMKLLPAIQAVDYLAGVHMRDSRADTGGLREGLSWFATAAWVTRSWTKAELLDTIAERGDFGFEWRGLDAAARNYFAKDAAALSVSQAAMIAALIGDGRTDPWCDPEAAARMRRRILERMRDNGTIDDQTLDDANRSSLGLKAPPANHAACM